MSSDEQRDYYLLSAGASNKAARALDEQATAYELAGAAYMHASKAAAAAGESAYQSAILARRAIREMDRWTALATERYLE